MLNTRFCRSTAAAISIVSTFLLSTSPPAASVTITQVIGTASKASAWNIEAQGLSGTAPQLAPFPNYISVSSNGDGSGTLFAPGFDPYNWDGVWMASYTFALPPDAINIRLSIEQIEADDKTVVSLNGQIIPAASYVVSNSQGTGTMNFGPGETPFPFNGFTSPVEVQAGFNVGASNVIALYVNNTGSTNPLAPSIGLIAGVDGTTATFRGTLEYVSMVPEASSIALLAIGLASLAGRRAFLSRQQLRSGTLR